ncbi:MAG TPA: MFS transporter [Gaiellaceae bacterium]|nr:MFS transporter [Gaiellaceae bacterium]
MAAVAAPAVEALDPRRWKALALVCAAFFMTVLDISIVNVALPTIGVKLHFSETSLQWVITAYALTFGGFLLLGGRAADYLGRRRVFMVGLVLFTAASLVCGLASSEAMLITSRAVQGLGAAIISPATLSIIMSLFPEGAERNKALGIWGAMGGSGAAVGVLAGGLLTKYLGWEWIFFVNVPVGAAALALTPRLVPESRVEVQQRRYDALGATLVTSGLVLLVYAISRAPIEGWGSTKIIVLLIASAALLLAFLAVERTAKDPILPFRIFRTRTVAGANVVGFLLGAVVFSNFFVLTLYVQGVLGWSALKTGATFIATAGTVVIVAAPTQALVTRYGPKWILATGMALTAGAMIWYAQVPVSGDYVSDLLPGYLMMGVGLAFSFIPVSIAALAGVQVKESGLASGLINTSQQIGGAIGVAVASTIAASHTRSLGLGPHSLVALTAGYTWAFWALAGIAIAGVIATITLVKQDEMRDVPEPVTQAG